MTKNPGQDSPNLPPLKARAYASVGLYGMFLFSIAFAGFASSCGKKGASVQAGTTGSGTRNAATNVPVPTLVSPTPNPYLGNLSSITVSGACFSGDIVSVVEIIGGATGAPVSTTCVGSAYSLTLSQPVDGIYSYNFFQQAVFNGEVLSNFSADVPFLWTLDGTPPTPPTITTPATNPFGSSGNSVTISGACEDNSTISLGGASTQSVVCASSTYSFTYNNSTDGTYDFTLLAVDQAGNGSSGPNFEWVRELKPPMVAISNPASSPVYSNLPDLTVAGSCKAGYTVTLSGVAAGAVTTPAGSLTQTCTGANTFTYVIHKTVDATYILNVTQTNPLVGTPSDPASVSWHLDMTAPAAPTVTSLTFLDPYYSNTNSITIAGGCEPSAVVYLSGDDTQSMTCTGSSTYTFTVSQASDATYNYSLKQIDIANNASLPTTQAWTRDTLAPSAPTVTSPGTSPYTSNQTTIAIGGGCEDLATVTLAGDSNQSVVCSSSAYSFNYTNSTDSTYNFTVHQTDPAGNASGNTAFQWIRSTAALSPPTITAPATDPYYSNTTALVLAGACDPTGNVFLTGDVVAGDVSVPAGSLSQACTGGSTYSFTINKTVDNTYNLSVYQIAGGKTSGNSTRQWILDRVAPGTPTITNPASPAVASSASALTIAGACEAYATVNLGGADVQNMVCTVGGTYSFTVSKSTDATFDFTVSETDRAGNASGSASQSWIRDTVTPLAPVIINPASTPYTSSSNPTLTGTCETGTTVKIYDVTAASYSPAPVTCVAGGFTFALSKSSDATYDFNLTQVDVAGNISPTTLFEWVRDNSIPATPVITAPASNPAYSNLNTVNITATCTNGNDVFLDGDDTQGPVACTTGSVTFTTAAETIDATYTYLVSQENTSTGIASAQASLQWIRDTGVPAVPVRLNPNITPYSSSGSLLVNGTCEANATVALSAPASLNAVCTPSGTFSMTVSSLADGTYSLTLKQTDRAGNASASTSSFSWTRNSALPATPTIVNPAVNPYITATNTITISGACITGYNVLITDVATAITTTKTCAGSTYSYTTASKASDNSYDFTVKQNNGGSNSGTAGIRWIRDTAAPVVTITKSPANPMLAWVPTFNFSATEAVTFACSLDGAAFGACTTGTGATTGTQLYTAGLSNASHTFQVRATDSANNLSNTASYTWTQAAFKAVALYHLNAAGPQVDSSSYTGANNNLITTSTNDTSAAAKFSEGRLFNGTAINSLLDTPSLSVVADKFTVEAWVQIKAVVPGNNTKNYYVVAGQRNAASVGWELRLRTPSPINATQIRVSFNASTGTTTSSTCTGSSQTFSTTGYDHIAATYNAGVVTVYFNGVQVGTKTVSTTVKALNNSTAPLRLGFGDGSSASAYHLNSILDEVRMSQIIRYTGAFTPSAAAFNPD